MKLFRLLFILIFFNLYLFANVILKAPDFFIKGESYIFEFEANGSSVKFPKIDKIDDFLVEDLGTSRSLQIINGNYDEKILRKFRIIPKKDFRIPSFNFEIDGKIVSSQSKKVVEKKVKKTSSDNFDLSLTPSKSSLFVGEDLTVKLIFKYKKDLQITNLGFESPHFENFWYKRIENSNKRYEDRGYIVQELEFLLFPQISGKLTIEPLRVDVQMIDNSSSSSSFTFFTTTPKVVKVYSNTLDFDVQNLPNNINLIGDFNIKTSIDRSEINLGQSVNYKIEITGIGNFEDITDYKLDIPNATIYDNKPEIKTKFTNKGYEGTFSKSFSIVPSQSIEIPSISFKYLDKKSKKVVTKKTKSFQINVKGEQKKDVVLQKPAKKENIEEKIIVKNEIGIKDKIIYFLYGILFTLLIFGLYIYVKLQKNKKSYKETPLSKLIKNSKDKKELMKILVPYLKNDSDLDELIYECQKSNIEFKVLKKQILEKLKEIDL